MIRKTYLNVVILSQQCRYRYSSNISNSTELILVYEGPLSNQLKRLRRVSISTSTLATIGLPLGIALSNNSRFTLTGQIAISSTILFSTWSSTLLFHLLLNPYVITLYEVKSNTSNVSQTDRTFIANKFNVFGNIITSQFSLSDCQAITVLNHPYATFKANNQYYYLNSNYIQDDKLKHIFDSISKNKSNQSDEFIG